MSNRIYNWPRFWHPPGKLQLDSHGFLIDPLSAYGKHLEAKPLDDIAGTSCLVLLGDPGMGKTHAMKADKEKVSDGRSMLIELGKQSGIDELSRRLFRSPAFRQWLKSGEVLYLFLDALDEGRLLIETVHHFLVAEFGDLPRTDVRNRLKLRISCRTADWPSSFSEQLKDLWGEKEFGTYQLAPLRRADILEAASQDGFDSEKFLAEIIQKEVGPLAARPVTLKMLLDVYREERALPARQTEIYEKGCLLLCEEPNRDRRQRRRVDELEAPQRLEVASRVAAMMVFGNKRLIQRDSLENPKEGEISIRDLAGDHEIVQGENLRVGEGAVEDVLRFSALFAGAGVNLSAWAHQTYNEFLAARYLVRRRVAPEKILALITHPEDPEKKIAPQLHETAAWLAGMNEDIFKGILDREPEVLLRSDVAGVTSESRAKLAEGLLRRLDSGELLLRWDMASYFHKLSHPGLVAELRPYIRDRDKRGQAREAAVAIAERAECRELAPDLLALALSEDEPERLRADAISALVEIADGDARSKLRALVIGEVPSVSHSLKARALRVLWPSHLSSEELLSVLRTIQSKEDLQRYQLFLARGFAKHLEGASVVPALRWIDEVCGLRRPPSVYLEKPVQAIMAAAWSSFDDPVVVESFARMLVKLSEKHVRLKVGELANLFRADAHRRRKLLDKMLEIIAGGEEVRVWVFSWPWNPQSEDTLWLLDKLDTATGETTRELLVRLIVNSYNRTDRLQSRAVAASARRHSPLKSLLDSNSKQRRQVRRFERQQEVAEKKEEAAKARRLAEVGRPLDKVDSLLRDFERGDLEAWWKIDYWLRVADDLEHELSSLEGDLSEAPGWLAMNQEQRMQIIGCAAKYIASGDPHTESWVDPVPNTSYRIPTAAYRAFRLVLQESPGAIEPIQWKRWAPAILHFLEQGGWDEPEARDVLLRNLMLHAADEVYAGLSRILDRKIKAGESLSFLQRLEAILDQRILELLWSRFPKNEPLTEVGKFLLTFLLRNDFDPAYEDAAETIRRQFREEGGRVEALMMAHFLVSEGKGCGWEVVWPMCLEDPGFGRELWLVLGKESGHTGLRQLSSVSPQSLGDLVLWLGEQFPVKADLESEDGLTDLDEVAFLRGRIVRLLENSGTSEGCTVLENLCRARPDWPGLRYSLYGARQNLRLNTYPWPTPRQVLELALDSEVRLVRTESELLDAVVAGLRRLQQELRQETPAAMDLWNEWGGKVKKYRPKSENQISDYVKRYLDRVLPGFGVIVNREVENRPRTGTEGEPGERTDILVNVRVPESQAKLAVIIETKGCWNDKLSTAMKTQLLDRYLRENFCRHGLYLVGWFNCPQWDRNDPRWKEAKKLDLVSLEMQLVKQAEQLSKDSNARLQSFVLNAALH